MEVVSLPFGKRYHLYAGVWMVRYNGKPISAAESMIVG